MVLLERNPEMNNAKDNIPIGITFEYIKLDASIEFFCARCGKRKIAKKYAQFADKGTTNTICNACYGNLKSKANHNERK